MSDRYLLLRGKSTALRIALPPFGALRIGRDGNNDLVIDEPGVEPQHVVLHYDATLGLQVVGGEVQVAGQKNVSLAAGESCDVAVEDRMRFGSVEMVVRPVEPATDSAYAAGEDGAVVAESAAMRAVIESAEALAATPGSVLILGETGAGKDVVAQLIHDRSDRAGAPLYRKSCADLADLDDAVAQASGGTILLDEVGGLSPRAQLSVGHLLERDPDVRFVFTSNHDLEEDVKAGKLRKDLYFRINRARIVVPPLREHPEDVGPLARHFVARAAASMGRNPTPTLDDGALEKLSAHAWPGNVRELQNVVERALLACRGDTIDAVHVQLESVASAPVAAAASSHQSLREEMAALEKRRILEALEKYPTQTDAAKALDIPLRTFLNRLDALGIPRARKSKK